MTNTQMNKMIKSFASTERREYKSSFEKGQAPKQLDINYGLPYIGINLSNGKEYFFQGEEASELLEEADRASGKFSVSTNDVLLWLANSWG